MNDMAYGSYDSPTFLGRQDKLMMGLSLMQMLMVMGTFAGAENWSRRRVPVLRRRWGWVPGPVTSAQALKLRSSATASGRRKCRWPLPRRSRWSPAGSVSLPRCGHRLP